MRPGSASSARRNAPSVPFIPAWVDRQVRHYLIALPYLLGCLTDLRPLGNYKRVALAEKVFGPARVPTP